MRHQHVGVDVVKMIVSSCSYLALAFAAWVLLRLVQACFYLPGILRRRNEEEALEQLRESQQLPSTSGEATTAKASTGKASTGKASTAKASTAKASTAKASTAKASSKKVSAKKRKDPEAEKLLQAEKSDADDKEGDADGKEGDARDGADEDAAADQPSTSAAAVAGDDVDDDKETKKDI